MNWKKLFEDQILERGYDYYSGNAIENFTFSANTIGAEVSGTEDYEVEISFEDGEISEMYCSCPYAAQGWNCKHMAAVLFEWAAHYAADKAEEDCGDAALLLPAHTASAYLKKTAAVQRLVEAADISVVQSFLIDVLADNEKLLTRFCNIAQGDSLKTDAEACIHAADRIAKRYLGRNHFIDYYQADAFVAELEEILATDAEKMLDAGHCMSAFRVASHLFTLADTVDMDDSDGGRVSIADQVYFFWRKMLAKASAEEKHEMFQWFTGRLEETTDMGALEDYLEQIIMEEFGEEEYQQPKMQLVKKKLQKAEQKGDTFAVSYSVGKWAVQYLRLLETQTNSKAEIESFCRQYWTHSPVQKYYMDMCMKAEEYDAALSALDEYITLDREFPGLVAEFSKTKKEIYCLQGNHEAYLEQLWKLLLEHDAGDLEIYRELKRQYAPEIWARKREDVFKKLPRFAHVERLYEEEKLYDRLLDFVLNSDELSILTKYTPVLKKSYPKQLLDKYQEKANQVAAASGNRKQYQQLVGVLRVMQKIEGGNEVVKDMVNAWRTQYKHRPAMQDELDKLS